MSDAELKTIFRPLCPSCGNILGDKEEPYKRLTLQGMNPKEAMDYLGINNICCRTRVLRPGVIPRGSSIEDYQSEGILNIRNVKHEMAAPNIGSLFILESYDGRDYITSVIPSQNPYMTGSITQRPTGKIFGASPYSKIIKESGVETVIETVTREGGKIMDSKFDNTSYPNPERRIMRSMNEPPGPRL